MAVTVDEGGGFELTELQRYREVRRGGLQVAYGQGVLGHRPLLAAEGRGEREIFAGDACAGKPTAHQRGFTSWPHYAVLSARVKRTACCPRQAQISQPRHRLAGDGAAVARDML